MFNCMIDIIIYAKFLCKFLSSQINCSLKTYDANAKTFMCIYVKMLDKKSSVNVQKEVDFVVNEGDKNSIFSHR